MKKQLLSIFALFLTGVALSQTIPNGGFENWNTSSFEDLQYFFTANTENHNGVIAPPHVTKTTDAYHGSYAVKITTTTLGTDTFGAYIANGNPGNPPVGGIPYNQKPTGVRVWYKCNIVPGDSGIVLVQFKKSGALIGSYIYYVTGTQSTYTLFAPALTFSPALSQTPDTMVFGVTSCNFMSNKKIFRPGSFMQVDSVSFTGVASQPVNFNGDMELWQTKSTIQLAGWQSYGYSPTGNFQTTDAYSGVYALELQTGAQPFGGGGGIQGGEANSGRSSNNGPRGGLPYNKVVDTLVFYYKYFPADPIDSAEFNINASANGVPVNFTSGWYSKLAAAFSYTKVEIPFSLQSTPDSLLIWFRSSKWPAQASFAGSDLKIDNMYLKSQEKPVSDFNMPLTGCVGQPVQLSDNSANAATSWSWIMPGGNPGSSTAQNLSVTYASAGNHTVTMVATNVFGSGSPKAKVITIYSLPSVAVTSATTCSGTPAMLTASGATTYTWVAGPTTSTLAVTPTVTTNYSVTGTMNGCSNTSYGTVTVPIAATPDICMISSDSTSTNNIIYWNKTTYTFVDSFIVYREVSSGNYLRIASISVDSLSEYMDTTRSLIPANGDPNVSTYRYKLQIRDSCGSYSPMSNYHTSVYFSDNHNGSFTWNTYSVESSTITPVSSFDLLRDDNNTGAWHVIASCAGTSNLLNDGSYSTYQLTANWRVQANGFNCTPTMRMGNNGTQAAIVKSKSNISNNRTTGISTPKTVAGIYPNPSTGVFTIAIAVTNATADVYDLAGKKVATFILQNNSSQIDISTLSNGTYFINVNTANGVYHEKINKTN